MKTYNNTQMTSAATNNLAKTGNDLAQQAFRKQGSVWHCPGRVGLVHQFVKDWINKAIPRRKDKVLKLLNAHEQRMIIQTTRLCGKLTPLFCSSKALARGIGRLPNHINCAHECHRQAHACHNQRALVAANDQSERSRARKNLQEAKRVACSFVKPPESKSVLSRESRLQDQIISVGVYPHLVVHLSFLVILRRIHHLVWVAKPASGLSSCARRPIRVWVARGVQGLGFLLPWSVPCRKFVGVAINILSQADPTANTSNLIGAA